MPESYDIISIGSGHNGLVAAAYMAAAGKKVLCRQRRNEWFGGGVVTAELHRTRIPARPLQHRQIFIQANPLIKER